MDMDVANRSQLEVMRMDVAAQTDFAPATPAMEMADRTELVPATHAAEELRLSSTLMARLIREHAVPYYDDPRDRRKKLVRVGDVEAALKPDPNRPVGQAAGVPSYG